MEVLSFGEKLKHYRKASKITQTELGKILKVSQVTIANYERGERFPKQDTLRAIAKIFDISLDLLLQSPKDEVKESSLYSEENYNLEELLEILKRDRIETASTYTLQWKVAAKMNLHQFFDKVFSPLLEKTGTLWMKGELLVSEEHIISNKVRELILDHANREWERNPVSIDKEKRWLGFCPPGENHSLALLMFSQILRLSGWHTSFLGTQVPYQDLSDLISKYKPTVIGISVSLTENLESLKVFVSNIREKFGEQSTIIVGGRAVSYLSVLDLPGINGIARNLSEGLQLSKI